MSGIAWLNSTCDGTEVGRFLVCRSILWDIAAEDPGESGRIMGGLATGRAGLQAVAIK